MPVPQQYDEQPPSMAQLLAACAAAIAVSTPPWRPSAAPAPGPQPDPEEPGTPESCRHHDAA
jgi:hypothetical protein